MKLNTVLRSLTTIALVLLGLSITGCDENTPTNKPAAVEKNTSSSPAAPAQPEVTELTCFYPVNVGGNAANFIDKMVREFNRLHPEIYVEAVYTGNYLDTVAALEKARREHSSPELFISLAGQRFDLYHKNMIQPLDRLINEDPEGKSYIADFLEGFMLDSRLDGKVISIPFQRSTEIIFYNKNMFREAGLDSEKFPTTWEDLRNTAQVLTKDGHFGVGLALNRSSVQWTFTGFCLQNSISGENLMSDDGRSVRFNTPENVEALRYWIDLQRKYRCMPPGIIQWTDLPVQFIRGEIAMIYHTTGNLEKIRSSAPFDFGCAFLPGNKRSAAPTGGGNFYISSGISENKQQAAWKFIKFCTETERSADWALATGYIPVRTSCFETDAIRRYYAQVPQAAVAYKQLLQSTIGNELSTYRSEEIWDILDRNIESAVMGDISPEAALSRAQTEAEKILGDL